MKLGGLFLFDYTGLMAMPWADAGYICYCVDTQHEPGERWVQHGAGWLVFVGADVLEWWPPDDVKFIFAAAFIPCDHTAVSGSKHFLNKGLKLLIWTLKLWDRTNDILEHLGCPYMIENPRSVISTHYRKADLKFDPCMFGGYLPEDDVHPLYPDYIPPRDAYNKDTWLWIGNGFVMPDMDPVTPIIVVYENGVQGSPQFTQLGGKSQKTKNIRSATPRGFARAAFQANAL